MLFLAQIIIKRFSFASCLPVLKWLSTVMHNALHNAKLPFLKRFFFLCTGFTKSLLKSCYVLPLVLPLLFGACQGADNYAPISDRARTDKPSSGVHIVSKGETLYSIAWRYNLDFRKLAVANNIGSDFRILPGQKLRLTTFRSTAKTQPSAVTTSNTDKKVTPVKVIAKKERSVVEVKTSPKVAVAKQKSVRKVVSSSVQKDSWLWPVRGKILRKFSTGSHPHKGLDISGYLGQSINAAGSGTVVYAGSGLVGYGKLLIIKHSDRYLSAYGHNRKLLVVEGETVKQGQQVAEMGDTGTNSVKLHFELRRDGKPVNPLAYLPKQ